jgi:hypothetical protein
MLRDSSIPSSQSATPLRLLQLLQIELNSLRKGEADREVISHEPKTTIQDTLRQFQHHLAQTVKVNDLTAIERDAIVATIQDIERGIACAIDVYKEHATQAKALLERCKDPRMAITYSPNFLFSIHIKNTLNHYAVEVDCKHKAPLSFKAG